MTDGSGTNLRSNITISRPGVNQLRSIAQEELAEIRLNREKEEAEKTAALDMAERYNKRKQKKERSRGAGEMSTSPEVKGPRLRPAEDVLERIRWDPALDSSKYLVGYLERFDGIKEMSVDSWLRESTEEDFIPQHRIKYFKLVDSGEIVWHRDNRIDKIFGTGSGVDSS